MEDTRLQKYLAGCGVASRRASEVIIADGRVTVNGKVITDPAVKVKKGDTVCVDGKKISLESKKVYIMMNKPVGVLSSAKDDRDRKCVVDLVEGVNVRLFPVGRLDYDTSGLILLTNDGDFMQKLTHPSYEIWRAYEAVVKGVPNENQIAMIEHGVELDDGMTLPAHMDVIGYKGKNARVEIIIREGRNRQVRRMMEKIGHPVLELKRVQMAALEIGDLKPGAWRYLKGKDFEALFGTEEAKKMRLI
ncbi:MAG: rRNA pseudouridine synthase [Clostridia bacterium]|nr:rRNA pseudouridine synthase [Clostridia bacterium]